MRTLEKDDDLSSVAADAADRTVKRILSLSAGFLPLLVCVASRERGHENRSIRRPGRITCQRATEIDIRFPEKETFQPSPASTFLNVSTERAHLLLDTRKQSIASREPATIRSRRVESNYDVGLNWNSSFFSRFFLSLFLAR